jgi:hypothetical protein
MPDTFPDSVLAAVLKIFNWGYDHGSQVYVHPNTQLGYELGTAWAVLNAQVPSDRIKEAIAAVTQPKLDPFMLRANLCTQLAEFKVFLGSVIEYIDPALDHPVPFDEAGFERHVDSILISLNRIRKHERSS